MRTLAVGPVTRSSNARGSECRRLVSSVVLYWWTASICGEWAFSRRSERANLVSAPSVKGYCGGLRATPGGRRGYAPRSNFLMHPL